MKRQEMMKIVKLDLVLRHGMMDPGFINPLNILGFVRTEKPHVAENFLWRRCPKLWNWQSEKDI